MPMVKWIKKLFETAIECFQTYCQNRVNAQFTSDPLASEKIKTNIETEGSSNLYLTEGSANSYTTTTLANQNFKSVGEFPSSLSLVFQSMVESQKAQNERADLWIKKLMDSEFALEFNKTIQQPLTKIEPKKEETKVLRKMKWKDEMER
jgi:hypothetical protein